MGSVLVLGVLMEGFCFVLFFEEIRIWKMRKSYLGEDSGKEYSGQMEYLQRYCVRREHGPFKEPIEICGVGKWNHEDCG